MKSSVTLSIFKTCFNNIKEICSENLDEFKEVKLVAVKPIMYNVSKWSNTLPKLFVWKRIIKVNVIMHDV